MSDDLIEYFLKWELGWLIPCEYENKVKEIKKTAQFKLNICII